MGTLDSIDVGAWDGCEVGAYDEVGACVTMTFSFGKPAFTTTLPAQLALKYNLSIVPVYIKRVGKNKFKIKFEKEILPKNFENKFQITEKLNQVIENMIIKNPKQWIWTHNRWK